MPSFKFPKNEEILHFIWMNQYFSKTDLKTTAGENITVFHPGFHNLDSGPDFSESKLKINNIDWSGQVEIHLKASEWYQHNHHTDNAYDNVILHVVLVNDKSVFRKDGTKIPTLELNNRIDQKVINNYRNLDNLSPIPCSNQIDKVDPVTINSMVEAAAVERISKKVENVNHLMTATINDWESITWRFLLQAFGLNKNKSSFQILGRIIPWKRWSLLPLIQKEALVFGQAGMLEESTDEYTELLKKEYQFMKYKWNLHTPLKYHHWKFMRMRPSNFPTIRIAQFCALSHKNPSLFHKLLSCNEVDEFYYMMENSTSEYWKNHYHFRKKSPEGSIRFGKEIKEKLMINFVVPLLFGYSDYIGDDEFKIKGMNLLESLKSEQNKITDHWNKCCIKAQNALHSQGLLQLFDYYCKNNRCITCQIGQTILSLP